jgi:steroid delta-isomerase-like uncharacterized protein
MAAFTSGRSFRPALLSIPAVASARPRKTYQSRRSTIEQPAAGEAKLKEGAAMSVENTRAVMDQYFSSEHSDVSMMAEDVVFTIMATGQEHRGRDGVAGMLQYFYHLAFDAAAETTNKIIADGQAAIEGNFVGTHIGEFAGIPATQKQVRVPLCVVYDLENDQIKRGRVYFEMPALMAQLGLGQAAQTSA